MKIYFVFILQKHEIMVAPEREYLLIVIQITQGHTPYPVILHHYLEQLRADHNGNIPIKPSCQVECL